VCGTADRCVTGCAAATASAADGSRPPDGSRTSSAPASSPASSSSTSPKAWCHGSTESTVASRSASSGRWLSSTAHTFASESATRRGAPVVPLVWSRKRAAGVGAPRPGRSAGRSGGGPPAASQRATPAPPGAPGATMASRASTDATTSSTASEGGTGTKVNPSHSAATSTMTNAGPGGSAHTTRSPADTPPARSHSTHRRAPVQSVAPGTTASRVHTSGSGCSRRRARSGARHAAPAPAGDGARACGVTSGTRWPSMRQR
jgi:hypothetical protein